MENSFTRFKNLFQKYTSKDCSVDERNEFLEMVKHENFAHLLKELIKDEVDAAIAHHEMEENKADEIFNKIILVANSEKTINIHSAKSYHLKWWAAAAVLIILAGGTYFFSRNTGSDAHQKITAKSKPVVNDLAPGHAGAILTLANGKTIILDSAHNGLLASQGNTNIVKEDARISYDDKDNSGDPIMYNTMTTPKGRQYQLILSDGSKVWLNAASSITFPTRFSGKERRVSVTGEVYFEISHLTALPGSANGEDKIPFYVDMDSPSGIKREIKVLGTHFNVMDYNNETAVKTTLLEGSVVVTENNSTVMIKPGEQAIIDNQNNKVSVVNADVDEAIAWKNGFFSFKNATIETVMRQVERWYDVDVIYNGTKPEGHYRGEVPMNVNASEMLKVLEVSGIHFKIDGKRIIVEK